MKWRSNRSVAAGAGVGAWEPCVTCRVRVAAAGALAAMAISGQAAVITWDDGDGGNGTIGSAGWNDIHTAIVSASAGPATRGIVRLSGDFKRALNDTAVGSLEIVSGVITLSGGWDTGFNVQVGRSVLDVTGTHPDDASNRFRVLYVNHTNAVLDSLVVSNSVERYNYSGNDPTVQDHASSGAGICIDAGGDRATLTNLVVVKNSINGGSGAGVSVLQADGVRITHCQIVSNSAEQGAGLYIAGSGSPSSPVVVEYCDFTGNDATAGGSGGMGGALFVDEIYSGSKPFNVLLANCRLVGNTAYSGAAMGVNHQYAYADSLTFFGCLMVSNALVGTTGNGAAVYFRRNNGIGTRFVNCTIVDNAASDPSKYGLYLPPGLPSAGAPQDLEIVNSITVRNGRGYSSGRYSYSVVEGHRHGYVDLQNTTVQESHYQEVDTWAGETNLDSVLLPDALAVTGTNAFPGYRSRMVSGALSASLEANLDADPVFLGTGSHPWQLAPASTSRDSGAARTQSGYTWVDVDFDGIYTALKDIIVGGFPPGAAHLVYRTDLRGYPRLTGAIDRGAYEVANPKGTVVAFR